MNDEHELRKQKQEQEQASQSWDSFMQKVRSQDDESSEFSRQNDSRDTDREH